MISSYVSFNEQSCNTCDYFLQINSDIDNGDCLWIIRNPVPIAYNDNVSSTYRTWGKDCPCWAEKKLQKVVDRWATLGYNYIIDTNSPGKYHDHL